MGAYVAEYFSTGLNHQMYEQSVRTKQAFLKEEFVARACTLYAYVRAHGLLEPAAGNMMKWT